MITRKTYYKVLLGLCLFVFISMSPVSAGTVNQLTAVYHATTGMVTVQGAGSDVEKGIVTIEMLSPSNSLMYFGTAFLSDDGTFVNTFEVGSLSAGTYRVRSADYSGGAYRSTQIIIAGSSLELEQEEGQSGAVIPMPVVVEDNTAKRSISTQTNSSGLTTAQVTGSEIAEMLKSEVERLLLVVEMQPGDVLKTEVKLDAQALALLEDSTIKTVTVSTPHTNISLGKSFFEDLPQIDGASLTFSISVVDPSDLPLTVREKTGGMPVLDFSINLGATQISEFDRPITVSVPYTLADGEDVESIVVYYIDDSGMLNIVTNGYYNPETKMVTFSTKHFSYFAIAFNGVEFDDVYDWAWYRNAVKFIGSREITKGVSANRFGPTQNLTRGQFIVMLLKAYGIQPDSEEKDNFADAGQTYYTEYLAAAKKNGIASGIGGNLYLPERRITMQEIYVMIHRAMIATGFIPEARSSALDFTQMDAAEWAKGYIEEMAHRGVITQNSQLLNLRREALRLDLADVLYRSVRE